MINDLAKHAVDRIDRILIQSLDLLDNDADRLGFILAISSSLFESYVATLANIDPALEHLPPPVRSYACFMILMRAQGVHPCGLTVQQASDLAAAVQAYPKGVIVDAE